jgi:glyoxylase-like metal-dependent hydrolase (beta-lactamase superfamily II)
MTEAVQHADMTAEQSTPTTYRVHALKYAQRDARRGDHFLGGDPHDAPMPMDYFVWAVVGPDRTWVVDTGFVQADATARDRRLVRTVTQALATIDIDAATVTDVIITHLHYDHIGGHAQVPMARFHVQDREMAFATGRNMTRPGINHAFTATHIAAMVMLVHGGRVVFHDGVDQLADGLSVHHVGGHTDGLQVVRVRTDTGWLVLASDASHFYENIDGGRPFTVTFDVDAVLAGFDTLRRLADRPELIVPGHDPLVLQRFAPSGPHLDGIAVRLDRPRGAPA